MSAIPRIERLSPPTMLTVESTSRCNLECVMCTLTQGRSSTSQAVRHLPVPMLRALLAETADQLQMVCFTGFGEPMLHPAFVDLLRCVDDFGVGSSFSTNGVVLPAAIAEALPTLAMLRHVNISIDSPDPEVFRAVRGGKLSKVLGNAGRIAALPGRFAVSVSSVAMRETVGSLTAFPERLKALGIDHYIVQSFADQSLDGTCTPLHEHAAPAQAIVAIEDAGRRHGVEVSFETPDRVAVETAAEPRPLDRYFLDARRAPNRAMRSRRCTLPWTSAHVDAAGVVFPCCRAAGENASPLGRLTRHSFRDIWSGPLYQEFREALLLNEGRSCPDVCARCTVAPLGRPEPPVAAAEVIEARIIDGAAEVTLRNLGDAPWTGALRPAIGTSNPRDRESGLQAPEWLSANRAALPVEDLVPAGGLAHYRFPVWGFPSAQGERFEAVVDSVGWIAGTMFALALEPEPNRYAARIDAVECVGEAVVVAVANIGRAGWFRRFKPLFGTDRPRDRASAAQREEWLSPNRMAGPRESALRSGETAHYRLDFAATALPEPEHFTLVVDGYGWFDGATIAVGRDAEGRLTAAVAA